MVKFYQIIIGIYLILQCHSVIYTQTDWEYVGVFKDREVFYIKSSVLRGANTFVIAVIKPINTGLDDQGIEFEYATMKCIYRKNYRNEVKCIISNRIYHYKDNTVRKSDMPNIELSLNYDRVVSDLYNKIK